MPGKTAITGVIQAGSASRARRSSAFARALCIRTLGPPVRSRGKKPRGLRVGMRKSVRPSASRRRSPRLLDLVRQYCPRERAIRERPPDAPSFGLTRAQWYAGLLPRPTLPRSSTTNDHPPALEGRPWTADARRPQSRRREHARRHYVTATFPDPRDPVRPAVDVGDRPVSCVTSGQDPCVADFGTIALGRASARASFRAADRVPRRYGASSAVYPRERVSPSREPRCAIGRG